MSDGKETTDLSGSCGAYTSLQADMFRHPLGVQAGRSGRGCGRELQCSTPDRVAWQVGFHQARTNFQDPPA